jgi:hypothetical protein
MWKSESTTTTPPAFITRRHFIIRELMSLTRTYVCFRRGWGGSWGGAAVEPQAQAAVKDDEQRGRKGVRLMTFTLHFHQNPSSFDMLWSSCLRFVALCRDWVLEMMFGSDF